MLILNKIYKCILIYIHLSFELIWEKGRYTNYFYLWNYEQMGIDMSSKYWRFNCNRFLNVSFPLEKTYINRFDAEFSPYSNALLLKNFIQNCGQKQIFIFTGWNLIQRLSVTLFPPYCDNLSNLLSVRVKEFIITG